MCECVLCGMLCVYMCVSVYCVVCYVCECVLCGMLRAYTVLAKSLETPPKFNSVLILEDIITLFLC